MIEYNILDDPSRNVEYGVDYWCDQEGLPYTSPDWKGPGLQRVNTLCCKSIGTPEIFWKPG